MFVKENESLISEIIKIFTEMLLLRKIKREINKFYNRSTALAHCIINTNKTENSSKTAANKALLPPTEDAAGCLIVYHQHSYG